MALRPPQQSIGLLAASCLGGTTVVNYAFSFRTPDNVRSEWARLGTQRRDLGRPQPARPRRIGVPHRLRGQPDGHHRGARPHECHGPGAAADVGATARVGSVYEAARLARESTGLHQRVQGRPDKALARRTVVGNVISRRSVEGHDPVMPDPLFIRREDRALWHQDGVKENRAERVVGRTTVASWTANPTPFPSDHIPTPLS